MPNGQAVTSSATSIARSLKKSHSHERVFQKLKDSASFAFTLIAIILNQSKGASALPIACNSTFSDSLVASYPFTGHANDTSGNGHHGTIIGGVQLTMDRFNIPDSAFNFDGSGRINLGNSPDFDFAKFTFAAWVAPSASIGPGPHFIFGKVGTYEPANLYAEGSSPNNMKLVTSFATEVETNHVLSGIKSLPLPPTWTHIALTYDESFIRFYLNGTLDSIHPRTGVLRTNDVDLAIGSHLGSANFLTWEGAIDEVAMWSRALSDNEVLQLMEEQCSTTASTGTTATSGTTASTGTTATSGSITSPSTTASVPATTGTSSSSPSNSAAKDTRSPNKIEPNVPDWLILLLSLMATICSSGLIALIVVCVIRKRQAEEADDKDEIGMDDLVPDETTQDKTYGHTGSVSPAFFQAESGVYNNTTEATSGEIVYNTSPVSTAATPPKEPEPQEETIYMTI